MSIVSAMYAGVSGVKSFSTAVQTIGNNLANLNTVGFKSSRTEFADLLSKDLVGLSTNGQIGRGVRVQDVSRDFSQGSFNTTNVATDVAVQGNGWFKVMDPTDPNGEYFTRDGQFRVDNSNHLVNAAGYRVQGFMYDQQGLPTTVAGDVDLTDLVTRPEQTGDGVLAGTGVTMSANLDSEATTPVDPFVLTDPNAGSNFVTSIRVYDSLGNDHEVSVFFRKTGDNTWEWHGLCDGADITGGTAGEWVECASGSLEFDSTGSLVSEQTTASNFNFSGGANQNQTIGFDFGDALNDGGTGIGGTTQFAAPSVVNYQAQDGYAAGTLVSIGVDTDGVVTGMFSNGRTRPVAQIGLAMFPSEYGLKGVGGNLFTETAMSGQDTFIQPGTGNAGTLVPSALEMSNVDMSTEFVNLIQNQRAYQANTRTITVSDEMLSETVNLIR